MPTLQQPNFRIVVWPFAIAQTINWASCYYLFPALLLVWEQDLGWSKTALVTAFTCAIIFSALLAPFVGRLIDHGKARQVLSFCSLFAALLLVLLSCATQYWQFFLIWLLLGMAMAGMLYEACFTVLTHTMGGRAKQAITVVTLVAGFAGTVSFPSAHYLAEAFGWRSAVLVFAAAIVLVSIPLTWIACSEAERHKTRQQSEPASHTTPPRLVFRSAAFWLLAIGFTALAVNHGAIISHLLPLLNERQIHPETAVLAASMIGPMQVIGRMSLMVSERHVSIFTVGNLCFISMAVAAACLLFAGNIIGLLVVFVVLQGAGHGLVSIIRPVVTVRLLGQANFGVVSGMIALPYMLGFATGPTLAALIWSAGGYYLVLQFAFALAIAGLIMFRLARRFSSSIEARGQSTG